ncbi:unnamed protein product [Ixodes hexagonus]
MSDTVSEVQQLGDLLKQDGLDPSVRDTSIRAAQFTLAVMVRLVRERPWQLAGQLLDLLRHEGAALARVDPTETAVGNVVRRVLKLVRDDYASMCCGRQVEGDSESLQKLVSAKDDSVDDYSRPQPELRERLLESLDELDRELALSRENIAAQALEHIHSGQVIMTTGRSGTVEAFLRRAATERTFQVIVTESAPAFSGLELARALSRAGIRVTVVPDSAVLAMMPRVSKVIVGTHSVMADGGLKAPCGTHALALAARQCAVPLIVVAPAFKLTPQYLCSEDQEAFQRFVSPERVARFETASGAVQLVAPAFDYVPPDLVPLLVLNSGGNAPSYVYRLLSEMYHPDDFKLGA